MRSHYHFTCSLKTNICGYLRRPLRRTRGFLLLLLLSLFVVVRTCEAQSFANFVEFSVCVCRSLLLLLWERALLKPCLFGQELFSPLVCKKKAFRLPKESSFPSFPYFSKPKRRPYDGKITRKPQDLKSPCALL